MWGFYRGERYYGGRSFLRKVLDVRCLGLWSDQEFFYIVTGYSLDRVEVMPESVGYDLT